jgi:hypothetical protein
MAGQKINKILSKFQGRIREGMTKNDELEGEILLTQCAARSDST